MELKSALPLTLTLGGLGLVTSLFSTLLVIFMEKTVILHYAILGYLFLLAALCLFFAFYNNDDARNKGLLIVVAVLCIVSGITAGALPYNFHFSSSLVNRASVYFIILLGLEASVSVFWCKFTGLFAFSNTYASGLNPTEESILYIFTNSIVSFCAAFTIASSEGADFHITNKSIAYTIGIWIAAFLVNCGLGILIAVKGGSDGGTTMNTAVESAPIASDDYDKIA
ncbi:hypothetical protein TRFO_33032 [Tritrichomonas foetus]|uniref:Uncharacterized protein n=1 Tax=Tritrichomonas foetus TaxID=1144522 RepID=A0A1J4JNJ4_9EUKA|nr:hypothetical protein TRFO_33032 [Tritrichomonas foetus]|eukprot:OHT00282.1 hypothetical protein TRFO_33032 [Tritrichomonas foetus]